MSRNKFNVLYLLFPAALGACFWIASSFQDRSVQSFFGIAESDAQVLSFDHDVAVKRLFVKTGDLVKKGDTLAVLSRADLERQSSEQQGELAMTQVELAAEQAILRKEKELVLARLRAEKRETEAQIRLIRTEDSLKAAFGKNIYEDLPIAPNRLVVDQIAALKQEIVDQEVKAKEELRLIDIKLGAKSATSATRNQLTEHELGFIEAERFRLCLIAPTDGYMSEVLVTENALVSSHRDLVKISPMKPNRVVGFLHESAEAPILVGREVQLSSSARPSVTAKGTIIGSNPKLTELPLRLRKFIELRAWGREVFVQIQGDNQFFISEKIVIHFPES